MIALYASQAQTEVTAPDFWQQVGMEMERRGVRRSYEECQAKWFQVGSFYCSDILVCVCFFINLEGPYYHWSP